YLIISEYESPLVVMFNRTSRFIHFFESNYLFIVCSLFFARDPSCWYMLVVVLLTDNIVDANIVDNENEDDIHEDAQIEHHRRRSQITYAKEIIHRSTMINVPAEVRVERVSTPSSTPRSSSSQSSQSRKKKF
ncbi:12818_t:CDS:2, partial [Gigaspora rosea]